jgi:uncharacterized protein YyaL (SSP411 family)
MIEVVYPAHSLRRDRVEHVAISERFQIRKFKNLDFFGEWKPLIFLVSHQVLLIGSPSTPNFESLSTTIFSTFLPSRLIIYIDPLKPPVSLVNRNETVRSIVRGYETKRLEEVKPNAIICQGKMCGLPIYEPEELDKELKKET